MSLHPANGYAGDVSPQLACQWWQAGEAALVDVRSDAERVWVLYLGPSPWRGGNGRGWKSIPTLTKIY
jgi:rhodanese-related sulfurtransferase